MLPFTNTFVEYCKNNFELNSLDNYNYRSLPICIIDCVYSLRAKYYSVTLPIVNRYSARYLGGDKTSPDDSISHFLQHIDELGGPSGFADSVILNHQKLGGKTKIAKENVCYQLARYLKLLHIETIEDFQKFESPELLEIVIRSVNGMGDAGVNYLFMLAGNSDRCKLDVHIQRCIYDACGVQLNNEDCQTLFRETVQLLIEEYPNMTVRKLDGIIWQKYQDQA